MGCDALALKCISNKFWDLNYCVSMNCWGAFTKMESRNLRVISEYKLTCLILSGIEKSRTGRLAGNF